jgi:predicted nucleotidyltransferase
MVKRLMRDDASESSILVLEFLHAIRLHDLEAAVLLAPSVKSFVGDAELSDNLLQSSAARQLHLCFAQLVEDLLSITLLTYPPRGPYLVQTQSTDFRTGPVFWRQVNPELDVRRNWIESRLMSPLPIHAPITEIADLCKRHEITRLSLFGSVLREDFSPSSDIDVLVEFLPGKTPGFIAFAGLQMELSKILGRTVDLKTPADLSSYFRDEVLREARLLHAA